MKIRYEITLADLVAFNRYHWDHSPTMGRRRTVLLWVPAVGILLLKVLLALKALMGELSDPTVLIGPPIFGVVYALLFPMVYQWVSHRYLDHLVGQLYSEGANKGMLGDHELELTEDLLIEKTPYGELRTRLQALEKVVLDDGYSFIYLSALTAHVIPRNAIADGNYEAFVRAIQQRLAQSQNRGL